MGRDMSERGIVRLDEPRGMPELHANVRRAPSEGANHTLTHEATGTCGTALRGVCPVDVYTRAGHRIRSAVSVSDVSRNVSHRDWVSTRHVDAGTPGRADCLDESFVASDLTAGTGLWLQHGRT